MKVTPFAKFTVLLNCAVPAIILGWDAWTGQLGANPVNFAIRTTGLLSLIFLLLTLLVTPASRITRWSWLGQFRRMMGLYAFLHACLHFLIFFGFDRGASASGTLSEIIKRPYLMVGTFGLVLMVPLAATSTDGMIRRLGGKLWKALHRLAYVVAVAGVVHYYMLVKADVTQPLAFAAVLAVLLVYRLVAHYLQLRSAYSPAPIGPHRNARTRHHADGEAEVLVGSTEGRAGLRRDARGTHVPPRSARRHPPAVRLLARPVSEPFAHG